MFVIRKKLSASEITPSNLRWNVDCSCVQQTFDGGTTWVDAPGQDPRSSDAFRAPALTTSDPRCDAAANMLAKLHAAVEMAIAFDNSVRLASELFALFALAVPALGVVVAVFTIIADVLLALGAAAIDGAFTSDVYDRLLCVFFDHIDSSGQMSDAQLSDIYDAVAADFDVTVQAVFGAVSSAAGAVGWSNAGALGSETGDCSTCDVWCRAEDFSIEDYGWTTATEFGLSATYTGSSWDTVPTFSAPNSWDAAGIEKVFVTPALFTEIDIQFNNTLGTISGACPQAIQLYLAGTLVVNQVTDPAVAGLNGMTWVGAQMADKIVFVLYVSNAAGTGTGRMLSQVSKGTGDNPFGANNC